MISRGSSLHNLQARLDFPELVGPTSAATRFGLKDAITISIKETPSTASEEAVNFAETSAYPKPPISWTTMASCSVPSTFLTANMPIFRYSFIASSNNISSSSSFNFARFLWS